MRSRIICMGIVAGVFFALNGFGQMPGAARKWGDWVRWGDQGDGTYANPVLPGDYSDIDCIRVGRDYYAVSSTFQYSPSMVILHSVDLVNWRILGHVVDDLTKISPEMNWDKMNRYGRGIWAGAIRFHNDRFWVYFGDPDKGYFVSTAKHVEGPWAPPHRLLNAKGWDDCCPFWDEDGQGYLIGTHFSDGYKIHLFKMSEDGKQLIKGSDKIMYQSKGSEANKLYKINGVYYHLFSEIRKGARVIMMERSKHLWGPYEGPRQLSAAQKQYHEPNQGALIQAVNGNWYFLTHHGTGGDWAGRILSLLPVHWLYGWPIIGEAGPDRIGRMVWRDRKPAASVNRVIPQTDDGFNEKQLPPQWEWNYQPRSDYWSLAERSGWLRLYAFRPLERGNLLKAGNTLTQRSYRTSGNEVIVKMDISGMADGQKAGLAHYGFPDYATIGITCNRGIRQLAFTDREGKLTGPVVKRNLVWLKSTWGLDGISAYAYSLDGSNFVSLGKKYLLKWGAYRGDRIAIYNYNDNADKGYVDIDYFHYRYHN